MSAPNSERNWVLPLNEAPKFNHFIDTYTTYANEIGELPLGVLSIVIEMIRSNSCREEKTENDLEEIRLLYLIAGIFLCRKNSLMVFKDSDLERLRDIMSRMRVDMILQEFTLRDIVTPYINLGGWEYKMTPAQEKAIDAILEERANRRA